MIKHYEVVEQNGKSVFRLSIVFHSDDPSEKPRPFITKHCDLLQMPIGGTCSRATAAHRLRVARNMGLTINRF
jgi:hypothetical protein